MQTSNFSMNLMNPDSSSKDCNELSENIIGKMSPY